MNELDPICSVRLYIDTLEGDYGVAPGVPAWLSGGAVVAVLLLSHLVVRYRSTRHPVERTGVRRVEGFRWPVAWFARAARWSAFPMALQFLSVAALLLVIGAGLFGHEKNSIGPVITWTWWWALLIFMILGFGNAFCMVCPWEALSSLMTSFSLRSRVKKIGFELSWPRWARNLVPATALFLVLTWFELGRNVTHSASMTAVLALVMTAMAIMTAIIFEKRAFCRYVCLVGRVSGIYSLFSPVELRPESADVCRRCTSKACYHGTETTAPCPTNLFPGHLRENTYCTLCSECVRSCPHENMALRVRPLGADLLQKDRFLWDESGLAVVLLALTSFHGLTMTPLWGRMNGWLRLETGIGATASFSFWMTILVCLPFLLFWFASKVTAWWAKDSDQSAGRVFKVYAYSLIPVALFYHLAHNSMHFFLEAGSLIPLLSDPFGQGWDLFGTARKTYGPILSLPIIWWLQISFIVIGHVFGVVVADRMVGRLYTHSAQQSRALSVLLIVMIFYSCLSVWLISQPMEMKTAM